MPLKAGRFQTKIFPPFSYPAFCFCLSYFPFALASLTLTVKPAHSLPSSAAIAALASSSLLIVTKPKPLLSPVTGSVTIKAFSTFPKN